MLPEEGANIEEIVEWATQPTRTFLLDRSIGQIIGMSEGLEAMRQAVDIILHTERYHWQIYSPDSGIELSDLIGEERELIEVEFLRRLEDAFSMDERILRVENYKFTDKGDIAFCSFDVVTVFGTIAEQIGVRVSD